jgi:hypothetical protein
MFQPFFDFKTINIFSKNYNIVQKFGADMKFIEEAYGLCGANGSFSCIYCEEDIKKRWEAGDQNRILKINRKLERSRFVCSQNFKNSKKKLGYWQPSIMHIDFDMIVYDLLHVLLRISGKLFEALLFILNSNDHDSTSDNFKDRKNLEKFYKILSQDCKITNPFYYSKKNTEDNIQSKSFNGTEIQNIFEYFSNCSLESVFPDIQEMRKFSKCFNGFYLLYCEIKNYNTIPYKKTDLDALDKRLREWLVSYIPFLNTKESTLSPYVHIFVYHGKELLEIHGNLNLYNQQGLEKLNSMQTKVFFSNTNKKRNNYQYIEQLVDNRNRTEFSNLDGSFMDIDFTD